MHLAPAIPVLRVFAWQQASDFYLDFLGFTLDWEHQFEADLPRYAQIRRSELVLHLSEHHGDSTPGGVVFVPVTGIDAFQQELASKRYRYARPGVEEVPWGKVMEVADPFGNRLRFCELEPEPASEPARR
ncbi:glyoxalase superfamily protein [Cupriavidus sp. AU9028]|uniref:glyoxalase superfamily protein n=1 Tax=Cupriavidus sp. AU9028 TaxID=2871157 RepID=UPI001C96A56F|nr:glyoxalase superfamily protein [Cupriavidus sp. AU9028]MBY4896128.1 VOC family protein [Cupriavidus sp. AU9028]